MNKTTQTSVNNSESSSSIDLTSINNDAFLINKTTNIKNKIISSIFKQNKTSTSSDSTTNNESTDNTSSPIHKIRSMSLKNFQANFIPSNLLFSNNNNNNKSSKTSINNIDNEFDQFVKLEDADLIGLNFNNENMKLVLNENDKLN
jgi:hypothetical protein